MQVFYAPFRALEQQFAEYTTALQPGPQRRVLVLCPSQRVAGRLRRLCAQKAGFISNVFFVTFSQLLSRLDAENCAAKAPLLPSDGLHDYLLKTLLLEPGFVRYKPSRGFIETLKASLRDLADSLAAPDVLEEQLQLTSDPLLAPQLPHLQWLVRVYRAYLQKMDQVPGYRSYKQYFEDALSAAPESAYLHSFCEIVVYGFYELTGRQLELFNAITRSYSTAIFWVYAKHPAFEFGRKFFETNILGAAGTAAPLPINWDGLAGGEALRNLFSAQHAVQPPQSLHWTSAPDPEGEVFGVVKEMLRLHTQQGIAYEDMAVCARSLEKYKTCLPVVFAQNGVPLAASFSFGFSSRPLGVFLSNLFALARNGFDREDILAVVTSPYFKIKNSWRYLIEECLAQRDFSQWADLVRKDLAYYDPEFLSWLTHIKSSLEFLEKPLPWNTLCQAAQQLLEEQVKQEELTPSEKAVWQEMQNILNGFSRYACVTPKAKKGEFLDELFSSLQGVSLSQTFSMPQGVSALDALSMRAMGFKVVFLLGMNEKSFPQALYQDPFLKDYYRRILRDQLGFWLNQKMERFEEERLLFFCALEAAQEQLYVSFLRADAEGKPLVPSGYLVELARAAGTDLQAAAVRYISGRLIGRLKETPPQWLTEKEMSLLLAAEGADIGEYERAGLDRPGIRESLQAARQDASWGALHGRDGMVGCGPEILEWQNEEGFSPTTLQDLARCPMKYFLAKGVGLKEKEDALSRAELSPNLRGRAYHQILMDYYKTLQQQGLQGELFPSALQQKLEEAVEKNYTAQSYKQFGIYPVIWELILKDIREKLADFVVQDAQHLEGFLPTVFETLFEKMYHPAADLRIKLKGIVDRIDVNPQARTFRVLDYKTARLGGKDLSADLFKKLILQPLIYLLLAQDQPQTRGLAPDGAALLSIHKGYARQELSAASFEAVLPRAAQFMTLLMDLLRQGAFFINPNDHCQYCLYASICHKDAYRALLRAKHAPQARALEEAKQ